MSPNRVVCSLPLEVVAVAFQFLLGPATGAALPRYASSMKVSSCCSSDSSISKVSSKKSEVSTLLNGGALGGPSLDGEKCAASMASSSLSSDGSKSSKYPSELIAAELYSGCQTRGFAAVLAPDATRIENHVKGKIENGSEAALDRASLSQALLILNNSHFNQLTMSAESIARWNSIPLSNPDESNQNSNYLKVFSLYSNLA